MSSWFQLTIDCHDPERLVAFWAEVMGYVPAPPPTGHPTWRSWYLSLGVAEEELGPGDSCDRLVDPEGKGPAIWFQAVPEDKVAKNRLHLDIRVSGGRSRPRAERRAAVEAEAQRLVSLGATIRNLAENDDADHVFCVMHDPEGNEFCLV